MVFSVLVFLFVSMPVLEIMVLIRIHDRIGMGQTIALVILTGVLGAALARAQGFMIVREIQRDLNEGRVPAPRLIDGMMIIIAGVLLITPGLITDTVGFLLLVPLVRAELRMAMKRYFEKKIAKGQVTVVLDDDNFLDH